MLAESKICTKCKVEKPLEGFGFDKRHHDGRQSACRECQKKSDHRWREANREQDSARSRHWYKMNTEKARESARKRYRANLERTYENNRKWSKANPEKIREYNQKKYGTLKGNLNRKMTKAVWHSLRGNKNGRKWIDLTGYTVEQLKDNIERKFTKDMSWEQFLKGEIHIDHKVPIAVFNYEKPEDIDFKRCWSLENLQPLWAKENQIKGAKLSEPFQPALTL